MWKGTAVGMTGKCPAKERLENYKLFQISYIKSAGWIRADGIRHSGCYHDPLGIPKGEPYILESAFSLQYVRDLKEPCGDIDCRKCNMKD